MWMKKISLMIFMSGIMILVVNLYSFAQGFNAYSDPTISEDDFKIDIEPKTPSNVGVSPSSEEEKVVYYDLPKIGEKLGELTIPKLDRTVPIYHGTSKEILKKGIGHVANTVLPGEKDNSVLSGHRDTVFRGLGAIGVNDALIVSTEAGEFLYKVRKVRIVDKDDRTVIVPKPKSTLTVTTCYPFDFVGKAQDRYILVGELISSKLSAREPQHFELNSVTMIR